jgi:hypothetical protein
MWAWTVNLWAWIVSMWPSYTKHKIFFSVYFCHMARIFMTPKQNMFAMLAIYSCHAYKFFIYVAKYSQLHGWNIPINGFHMSFYFYFCASPLPLITIIFCIMLYVPCCYIPYSYISWILEQKNQIEKILPRKNLLIKF